MVNEWGKCRVPFTNRVNVRTKLKVWKASTGIADAGAWPTAALDPLSARAVSRMFSPPANVSRIVSQRDAT